jgi:glycosyltransferase involved in cell wall biosynthesis
MQKKKILHIIQSLGNGGCENMLLRTLPLLSGEFEHRIIALRELGELAEKFREKNISIETANWRGFFHISGYHRLLAKTKQFGPDIIITYLFHADMIGRLFLQRKVSVPVIPFLRTTYNHPKYLVARIFEWLTKPLVKTYLANSEAVKDFYVRHIGIQPEKITVIPNGLDVEYFDSVLPDPKLKKSLGISPDDFTIICVANLHVNKGHRYLLEAFETVSWRESEATAAIQPHSLKLLLVGDGEEKDTLLKQIEKYQSKNNILFLGRRSDVPQLLKISDCFSLPTLFEGMSNAIMEAMAAGLPVITTALPENRALIDNDKTGILVPTKSSKDIACAIKTLIGRKDFARALGREARRAIEKQFSLPSSIEKFRDFLLSPL